MKHLQKSSRLLSLAVALILAISLCVPASAFDAAKPTQNLIAAGYNHAGMIDEKGALWMWGGNDFGQLGNGGTKSSNVPVKIMENIVSVSASGYGQGNMPRTVTTAAIKSDGSLWTWGIADNDVVQGILGNSGGGNSSIETETVFGPAKIPFQTVPVKILDDVASVSLGGWCALAVKKDSSLWAWGNMGYDHGGLHSNTPVKVMDGVRSACAGPMCAAAIKTDGSLWMWGYDMMADEEIGDGDWQLSQTPTKVMDGVSEVSIGHNGGSSCFACIAAVKTDGSLWIWGSHDGNFGLPGEDSLFANTPIKMMDGVAHISVGSSNIAVVKTDGSLWTCGENYQGQLGNGTQENSTSPVKIMENVASVSAGPGFTIAVKEDGTVWSWGSNYNGELGNGGKGNVKNDYGDTCQTIPVQISGLQAKTTQTAQPSTPAQASGFTDVQPNAYYNDAVRWAVEEGITTGTSATTFNPGSTCTRAQIITFLWRANGSPEPAGTASVNDVKASDYYYKAVLWAAENGIISGKSFSPNSPCTRAMAVEFIWKQSGSPSASGNSGFTDVADSASYAKAVSWALDKGVTGGTSNTTFSPDATCTRAQIVTFLHRANS